MKKYNEKYYLRYGDPRTADWPLMDNVYNVVAILIVYLLLTKIVIPLWMRNRKPYYLIKLIFIYDICMFVLHIWIFRKMFKHSLFIRGFPRCEPIDFSNNEDALDVAKISWIFFISKLIQLTETIFMLLRKRDDEISTYLFPHRCLTPIFSWYGIKYAPGGYNGVLPFANEFILIWYYLYAALAAFGPFFRKYLWWKKYLMPLQLILYSSTLLYTLQIYLFPPKSCKVSFFILRCNIAFSFFFLFLSLRTYMKSYKKKELEKQGIFGTETEPISMCLPQNDDSDILQRRLV